MFDRFRSDDFQAFMHQNVASLNSFLAESSLPPLARIYPSVSAGTTKVTRRMSGQLARTLPLGGQSPVAQMR